MLKYNSIAALTELTMLKYFQKSLQFSILAKLQNKNLELKSFIQIIKTAIIAKAKANLQPQVTICNIDQNYIQGSQPAQTTAAKASNQGNSQGPLIKNSWIKNLRSKISNH